MQYNKKEKKYFVVKLVKITKRRVFSPKADKNIQFSGQTVREKHRLPEKRRVGSVTSARPSDRRSPLP